MSVDNIIGRLIKDGDTTFEAPAGRDMLAIEWHVRGAIVHCRSNAYEIDLHDPISIKRLETAYSHCMTHDDCSGCLFRRGENGRHRA